VSVVTIQDVQARLGRVLTDLEQAQVNAWLEDLGALVHARVPDLEDQLNAGTMDRSILKLVFAQAIRRLLLNPEGLRQYTESIDDYSVTKTVDSSVSSSALYLSDDEWAMLLPETADGAYSIRAVGASDRAQRLEWTSTTTWEVPLP